MRIVIMTDTFYPNVDGVVTAISNAVKCLAKKGHQILIIAPSYGGDEKINLDKNISVARMKSVPLLSYKEYRVVLPCYRKCLRLLKEFKPEVIHFQTFGTLGLVATKLATKLGLPLIGTFHTFFADPNYLAHAHLNFKVFEKLAWAYSNYCYRKCELITTPSAYTRQEIIKHGCKPPVTVISNGIDTTMFDNSKAATVKKKYSLGGGLVLFIGRIAHEKNLVYLVECFNLVVRKSPKTRLLIIGDGPQKEEIQEAVKDMKLEKNILLLGSIAHDDLIKSGIFKACDVFATASVTENQPLTILESQANGLVCVGVKAKGVPNLILHNKNGIIAQVGDRKAFAQAILKLLKDKKLYKKMQKATLEIIKQHDLDVVVAKWEETYKEIIKKNKEKAGELR
ncbi:glycosyltransferase family 4 protein [Candidatus Woesearchaeota archaeon]|nr:glycosyltransferase family 4 protein [Candidatus Woesearchaeota archaeon]